MSVPLTRFSFLRNANVTTISPRSEHLSFLLFAQEKSAIVLASMLAGL
jgi:hypothetical protein